MEETAKTNKAVESTAETESTAVQSTAAAGGSAGAALYARLNRVPRRGNTVAGALMQWGRADREYVAQQVGLPYEGIEDQDLAQMIAAEVTSKDGMRRLLLLASDEEIAAFERAIDLGAYRPDQRMAENLAIFSAMGYIASYPDGTQEVNTDAAKSYLVYCTPDFQQIRRQCGWLGTCIDAMFYIHGACPKKTLYLMFKRRYRQADMDIFMETFYTIPREYRFCDIVDGRFIYRSVEKDAYFRDLGKDTQPYFIPDAEEIEDIAGHGYASRSVSYQKLRAYLQETLHQDEARTEDLLALVCRGLRMRHTPARVLKYLKGEQLELTESEEQELVKLLSTAAADTRCPVLRGFTPLEEAQHNEVKPVKQ